MTRKIQRIQAQGRWFGVGDFTGHDVIGRIEEAGNGVNEPRNGYPYRLYLAYNGKGELVAEFAGVDITVVYGKTEEASDD